MLKATEVKKSYGEDGQALTVLKGVSFQVEEGESAVITGPSGCGKSTLLHILGTLDRPTSGEVSIAGKNPFKLAEQELARFRNEVVGFVFQDHHLLPQFTVIENVILPSLAFRRPGSLLQRATELLKKVGLERRTEHRPSQLSGGERQRAAVARALINRPRLLLCDEPTGSLDAKNAEAVAETLFELHQDQKAILIVVTHSLDLAGRFPVRYELREGLCSRA